MEIAVMNGITGLKSIISSVDFDSIYKKLENEKMFYVEFKENIKGIEKTILSKSIYNEITHGIYFTIESDEELICTMFIAKDIDAKNELISEYESDEDIREDVEYINNIKKLDVPFLIYNSMLEENKDGTTDKDTIKIVLTSLKLLEML